MIRLSPGVHHIALSGLFYVREHGRYTLCIAPRAPEPVQVTLVVVARGHQEIEIELIQEHAHSGTASKSMLCALVYDRARVTCTSLINITDQAQQVEASQDAEILLIGPQASACTQPAVQIGNSAVSCTHASAIGQLDILQQQYLFVRGLDPDGAQYLLAQSMVRKHGADLDLCLYG